MLRQIVVDAERVAAVVAEILADGAPGVGSEKLHRGGVGSRGHDDDRVLHRAVVIEGLDQVGDSGALLSDGDIDADHVTALLVDDRVDGDGGFAGLAVTDDQLALSAADGDHRVDRFQPGLDGFSDRAAVDHTGCQALDGEMRFGFDWSLAIHRAAQCVDDAADQVLADRHGNNAAGAADFVAFLEFLIFTQ